MFIFSGIYIQLFSLLATHWRFRLLAHGGLNELFNFMLIMNIEGYIRIVIFIPHLIDAANRLHVSLLAVVLLLLRDLVVSLIFITIGF